MTGPLCLEFVAGGVPERPAELAHLLVRLGLLSSQPAARPEDLAAATVLREAIVRCGRAAASGGRFSERDVATLNSFAGDETPVPILLADGRCLRAAPDPVCAALAAIGRDAVELLAGAPSGTLRACEGRDCGALFLDRSRTGKRRWCAMARCGNAAKVAAFRRRHRA